MAKGVESSDEMFYSDLVSSPISSISCAEQVDNGEKCTNRLSELYESQKYSDVTLIIENKKYHAHKILLANASDVFEQMLTSDKWKDSGKKELILQEQEDCFPVFGAFLRYIYTGQILLCVDSVLGLLVLADKYNISDLKECCCQYMSRHLVSLPEYNKAIIWYQYSIACNSQSLQLACFNYIVLNMDTVIQSPDWIYIDKENLTVLLKKSDLVVESEYVLLQAVMRWLNEESRLQHIRENLKSILPFIRFPMILPEHIAEFEDSPFQIENHDYFAPYLLAAYRYHALSIRSIKEPKMNEVPRTQFLYRNYTDENYSIHVDVVRKGYRTCPRVSSKVEKPLSVPLSICGTASERQCKMKITFYPQGFYTTSLWNGQLNLAKSVDETKMVIAHRGGVEVHEAEITILMYAQQNGITFAESAITEQNRFEVYGTFEIEDTIKLEKMKSETSQYVIDGSVILKVFVRPITFSNISD